MQTIEERLDQLEKRNRRLTAALAMLTVAICAVVTVAATGEKDGRFDTVVAQAIFVKNDAGQFVVGLDASDAGYGVVMTFAPNGKQLVSLGSTVDGDGTVTTFAPNGKDLVSLGSTVDGEGMVRTFAPNGKQLVSLGSTTSGKGSVTTFAPNGKVLVRLGTTADDTGGSLTVFNKTGEEVVQLFADEYGNGVVGAFNRKGKGRTLQPGP
jgi:hypothetical protein